MIKFSGFFILNEIHMLIALSTRIPKIYVFPGRGALIFGEGQPENLGKMAITETSIVMQIGVVNFEREYQPLLPDTKFLVMPQFFFMPHQI